MDPEGLVSVVSPDVGVVSPVTVEGTLEDPVAPDPDADPVTPDPDVDPVTPGLGILPPERGTVVSPGDVMMMVVADVDPSEGGRIEHSIRTLQSHESFTTIAVRPDHNMA